MQYKLTTLFLFTGIIAVCLALFSAWTYDPNPGICHGDSVLVTGGFHKGRAGIVEKESSFPFAPRYYHEYMVDFGISDYEFISSCNLQDQTP